MKNQKRNKLLETFLLKHLFYLNLTEIKLNKKYFKKKFLNL